MSQRQARAFAVSCLLALSFSGIPASAAPRTIDGGDDRDRPGISRLLKQVKKFIAVALDTLTLPTP
jgi:hypothetical protein